MKLVAMLALTLWTISSPALAAIRTECTGETDELAHCTDVTNGDAHAICGTTDCECDSPYTANAAGDASVCNTPYKDNAAGDECVCGDAYKDNAANNGCDPKGLTDTCAADTDCAAVERATCDGTPSVCVCSGAYKDNAAGNGCVCGDAYKDNAAGDDCEAKALDDTCAADTDCAAVTNSKCTLDTCSCDTKYVRSGATCTKLSDITCETDSGCPSGGGYTCTAPKCECSANYGLKDEVCVQEAGTECPENAECVTLKCQCKSGFKQNVNTCDSNGARGMTANIGLLCAILVMLSYMNTL